MILNAAPRTARPPKPSEESSAPEAFETLDCRDVDRRREEVDDGVEQELDRPCS